MTDTCVQGAWSETVEEAVWFDSPEEARDACLAAEIDMNQSAHVWGIAGVSILRVR